MKFKIFNFFLVLMLCGSGLYMLRVGLIPNSHFSIATGSFINSYMSNKSAIKPVQLRVNFTYRLDKVRISVPNPANKSLLQLYRVAVNSDEKNIFYFTIATFTNTLNKANITFMLYGGSMLGSRRHHGFIPWDDDIDVWINGTEKNRVRKLLASVKGFDVFSPRNFQWKFFYKNLKTLKTKKFHWPYIDIFFFNENATHVWEEQKVHRYKYYKRSRIFPLTFRPFDVFHLPTPCAIEEFVGNYTLEFCQTTNFIHRTEKYLPTPYKSLVSCKKLYHAYPFVFKSKFNATFSKEELKQGNKVISQFLLPNDPCGH